MAEEVLEDLGGVGEAEHDTPNIANILDLLGVGDPGPGSEVPATGNGDYVTLVMFEQVRKQLEEKQEEEVSSLKRSFDHHMEERRENEKRLKTCIETLMTEVVRLEERIEEIDKRTKVRTAPLPPPQKTQRQPGPKRKNPPQPHELLQVKMEDVEGEDDEGGRFGVVGHQNDPLLVEVEGSITSASFIPEDSNDGFDIIEDEEGSQEADPETSANPSETGGGVVVRHGRVDGVGNFLPFLCLCGLEFDSETFLSDHIQEEEAEGQREGEGQMETTWEGMDEEEEANFDPAQAQDPGHSNWASPQIQQIQSPRITHSRRTPGTRVTEIQHGDDPHRPLFCICGQGFQTQMKLYHHTRYYTKKDFSCMVCSKEFAYASHLKAHLDRVHSEAKLSKGPGAPLVTYSRKPANRPKYYKKKKAGKPGKNWYTGSGSGHGPNPSNPLQCMCGSRYADKVKLWKHVHYYNVCKSKGIACQICLHKFSYASQLNTHMARVHGSNNGFSSNNVHQQQQTTSSSSSSSVPRAKLKLAGQQTQQPLSHSPSSSSYSANSAQHGVESEVWDEHGNLQHVCRCGRSYPSRGALHSHVRVVSSGELLQQCHLCPPDSMPYSLVALRYHMKTKHNVE